MKKKVILILILLIFSLLLYGCNNSDSSQGGNVPGVSQSSNEAEESVTEADGRTYTLDMYMRIGLGNTYEEVAAITGSAGDASINGDVIKQYLWQNEDGSNISVIFSSGKATGKTQAYLGPFLEEKEKVTLKMFRQLTEGSSLSKVEKILGPGTETMRQTMDGGEEQVIYTWRNRDGSAITIVFEDGKATDINDLMLD